MPSARRIFRIMVRIMKISITGGIYTADGGESTDDKGAVYSGTCTGFITGGSFSTEPAEPYLAMKRWSGREGLLSVKKRRTEKRRMAR